MNNLQSEVMELEFNEFARGKWRITEIEFAEMLLRYTGAYDQAWNLIFCFLATCGDKEHNIFCIKIAVGDEL